MYRNLVSHCHQHYCNINVSRCLLSTFTSTTTLRQRCALTTTKFIRSPSASASAATTSAGHQHQHHHQHHSYTFRSLLNAPPNARKMSTDAEPQHTNRLATERSTYLLQHAHNPVDWYPWGEEAIQRARAEDKLIFLSVGYSTCHWCHVMEKECFENAEIAAQMNRDFVCIKVDREERPDIDRIYMNFVVLVTRSGGWPMSVWLTPQLAPISGGTYFPPVDRFGTPGFPSVLRQMQDKWKKDRVNLLSIGQRVIESLQQSANSGSGGGGGFESEDEAEECARLQMLRAQTVEDRFAEAARIYFHVVDAQWGGFRRAPKFPEVSKLAFLLQGNAHRTNGDGELLTMALDTLHRIADGGIHDHVFGGFARYAVDRKWHVPHFEKMLYDQGQLMQAYAIAYQVSGERRFADVADGIFRYVCKDLQHPEGGFYSGEDADSLPEHGDAAKIEGAFYAWEWHELCDVYSENIEEFAAVCPQAFELFAAYYGCDECGNVDGDSDPHGHLRTKNILMVQMTRADVAQTFGCDVQTVDRLLKRFCELLYAVRARRPRPHLDTKILTAWNGLMLSGLAKLASCGGVVEGEKRAAYAGAAKGLVEFLRANVYDAATKTIYRTCYGEGVDSEAKATLANPIAGFLDDYAFLVRGLLDYHTMSGDVAALRWARELQATQDRIFWDTDKDAAYFFTQADAANVVVRLKDDHDGAEPCGNSVAAGNLVRLYGHFGDEAYRTRATKLFAFYAPTGEFGVVLPEMLNAWLLHETGLCEVVVAGKATDETVQSFLAAARGYYVPGMIVTHYDPDDAEACVNPAAHADHKLVDGKPAVYVCNMQTCLPPITELGDLKKEFDKYVFKTKEVENN